MSVKNFIKWAVGLFVVVVGVIYIASAFLISEKIGGLVDFSDKEPVQIRMEPVQFHVSIDQSADQGAVGGKVVNATVTQPVNASSNGGGSAGGAFWRILSSGVQLSVFGLFLVAPIAIFYVFLIRPVKEIPLVEPSIICSLDDADASMRRFAGDVVARAMWSAKSCPGEDREVLRKALERPSEIDKVVKGLLASREEKAKRKAVEIATMAGLTMSISTLSIGDGLGMLFWKSKLVYDTFRIYGFRPSIRTLLSIWAHVVFAAFFAASIDELCELLDVSDIIGGVGVRVVQGIAGAAMIIKGGQLTRAYLMRGVSAASKKNALAEFRSSAPNVFGEVINTFKEHGVSVGLNLFRSSSPEANVGA